jgi:hypothetical protein
VGVRHTSYWIPAFGQTSSLSFSLWPTVQPKHVNVSSLLFPGICFGFICAVLSLPLFRCVPCVVSPFWRQRATVKTPAIVISYSCHRHIIIGDHYCYSYAQPRHHASFPSFSQYEMLAVNVSYLSPRSRLLSVTYLFFVFVVLFFFFFPLRTG